MQGCCSVPHAQPTRQVAEVDVLHLRVLEPGGIAAETQSSGSFKAQMHEHAATDAASNSAGNSR